jgi:hypothetical protein
MGKLALVGGVGVAWLLTFVLMGGDVLPALSSSPEPTASASASASSSTSPSATASQTPSPTATTSKASTPSKVALSAEALASSIPVGGPILEARPMARRQAPPTLTFRMATYNILGSSHTGGGSRSGTARASRGAQYVLDHGFSIVGFQEMQSNQRSTFLNAVDGKWGLLPGGSQRSGDGDNSIAWRKDTWKLIKADSVSIPYFSGKPRNIPVLLLKNKQTGITAYFTNFHNPADKFGNAQHWRNIAKQRQVELFKSLAKTGRPVFVTGDMNEHRTWACEIVTGSDMRVAAGGDGRGGCSVQTDRIVDWIAGSYDVQFSNYFEDRGPVVDYLTDHPIIYTDVRIDSRDFPRAVASLP